MNQQQVLLFFGCLLQLRLTKLSSLASIPLGLLSFLVLSFILYDLLEGVPAFYLTEKKFAIV